jgi:hypothetical protein
MNQPETTQWLIMKPQIYFISICLAMVFVISSDLAFAGLNATVEPADEVTYTDASSSDISEISDGIKNWVTKTFAGERTIKSLDVDAIIYTSPTMERVFIPGSYYVRMTINGDKLPGTVMCRTTTGMEMLPDRRRVPIDIVTPQHIIEGFRITTEEDAIFFHKALEHFYSRGDPNFSSNRDATKAGDIWTLTDTMDGSIEMGYKVKVDAEGKVLEISRYAVYPDDG